MSTPASAKDERNSGRHAEHPEPTATAPDSVEESVYEEADFAGRQGPNAADPPTAEKKSSSDDEAPEAHASGLDPDEGADVLQTREEAERIKEARDDEERQDEDIITIDASD